MIDITSLSHVTLIVREPEASKRFYGGVLGMREVATPSGFNPAITWFRSGTAELHLQHRSIAVQDSGDPPAQTTAERDAARARHIAFAVADIEATRRALEQHGVEVVLGPRPRGDGAEQLYCRDPDGHLVELHSQPTG